MLNKKSRPEDRGDRTVCAGAASVLAVGRRAGGVGTLHGGCVTVAGLFAYLDGERTLGFLFHGTTLIR